MKTKAKTGRKGVGEVTGFDPRLQMRPDGRLAEYSVRISKIQAQKLAELVSKNGDARTEFILAATSEKPERIRVMSAPPPGYERLAVRRHVRGDAFRITGTAKSCNISLSSAGARLVREELKTCLKDAADWIEMRARVVRFTKDEGPRCLIEFIPDSECLPESDDVRIGKAGLVLASMVWTPEDFSDWE